MPGGPLQVEEIVDEAGALRFRFSLYLSRDGGRPVRHGFFVAYHANGQIASELTYDHGAEHGLCQDFHPNGMLAARGRYAHGEHVGEWCYFWEDGTPEDTRTFN